MEQNERIFSYKQKLNFYDCTPTGVMRLSALMKLLGMTADKDYLRRGMSYDDLAAQGFVFMLSRESVHFERPIREGETITCNTWEHKIEGPMFYRLFELFGENGELLATANTAWVVVNPETRKILRPDSFPAEFRMLPDKTVTAEQPKRIKAPADGKLRGERTVYYSDLDANGHMNNANYGNLAVDFLDAAEQAREISDFAINFNREVKLGETLSMYTATVENETIVSAELNADGKNCFTAKLTFR